MSAGPRLLGRDVERDRLRAVLDEARLGRGGIVLIEGEAGIGKSRLLDEAVELAEASDVVVRRGEAEVLEQGRQFGALVDALGHGIVLASGDRSEATAEEERFLVQDRIVDHVDSLTSRGPVMLALDDLHWADRATLSTAWALARTTGTAPLLLVLAFRPAPRPPELERVVDGCVRLGAPLLALRPLDDGALAELATDIIGHPPGPGLVEQLRGARGNPFVGIELLRALEAEDVLEVVDDHIEVRAYGLPPALRHSLLRRFTSLPDDARDVLRVAAVMGSGGRVENLAMLMERPVADVAPLVREAVLAGLLEDHGDRLVFRHDLIRESLYEDLPESARVALHASAATALDGTADPAVVARHLASGASIGDAKSIHALRRIGVELTETRPDAAVDALTRALELEHDRADRADIAADLAEALLGAGRAGDADRVVVEIPTDSASSGTRARLYLASAESASHQGRPGDAVAAFGAALDLDVLSPQAAAAARGRQAENRLWTFALDLALTEAQRALEEGQHLGLRAVVTEALATLSGVHQFRAQLVDAVSFGEAAVEAAGNDPNALRGTPHAYLGLALLAADRTDEARQAGEEGRRRSVELGQILVLPNYHALLSRIAWFTGRWDDALMEADAAADLAEDFELRFGATANEAVRGLVAFHRGDLDTASAVLEARQEIAARGDTDDAAGSELLVLLRARLLEVSGDVKGAADALLTLFEAERTLGMRAARLWPGPDCVRLALAAGDRAKAVEIVEDLEAIATDAGTASGRAAGLYARGLLEDDAATLVEAAGEFFAAGRPHDELLAREAAGLAAARADKKAEAVAALSTALECADRLGAVFEQRRISNALRELGVRRAARSAPSRPRTGWESLTKSELEVAGLVAEGLTNPEIGERLFVSRRTVSTHLSHIFTKLTMRSRVELTAEVLRRAG